MKIKVVKQDGREEYIAALDNTRVVGGAARIPRTRALVSEALQLSQARLSLLNPTTRSPLDNRTNENLAKNLHLWQVDPTRLVTRLNAGVEFDNAKNLVKNTAEAGAWTGAGGVAATTAFKNYRLFPKANPTSRYRNVGGRAGYEDIVRSGKVRPPLENPKAPTGGVNLTKTYPYADWGGEGRFVDPTSYKGKYFVEGSTNNINFQRYSKSKWGVRAVSNGDYINVKATDPGVTLWKRWNIGLKEILHKKMPNTSKNPYTQELLRLLYAPKHDDNYYILRLIDLGIDPKNIAH